MHTRKQFTQHQRVSWKFSLICDKNCVQVGRLHSRYNIIVNANDLCYPSEKQSALTRYLVVINIFNINKYQPYININNIPLELAQLPLMSSQVISKRKVEHKYVFSFVISVIQIVSLHFLIKTMPIVNSLSLKSVVVKLFPLHINIFIHTLHTFTLYQLTFTLSHSHTRCGQDNTQIHTLFL